MKKVIGTRTILINVMVELFIMLLIGVVLIAAQSSLVNDGKLSIDRGVGMLQHFLVIGIGGAISRWVIKDHTVLSTLIATVSLYVLLLFTSLVVLDGVNGRILLSVAGGLAGMVLVLLLSIKVKNRVGKRNYRKYNC